jgi:multidrug resistance efflux pump
MIALPLAAALAGLLWPVQTTVTAPATVTLAEPVAVTAPGAVRIRKVLVEEGQTVSAGSPIAVWEPAGPPDPARTELLAPPERLSADALERQIRRAGRSSAELAAWLGQASRAGAPGWSIAALADLFRTADDQHRRLLAERERRVIRLAGDSSPVRVFSVDVRPGTEVAAGASLAVLGSADALRAEARVPAGRIGVVREGGSVGLRVTRHPERVFRATVAAVAAKSDSDGSFAVTAAVRRPLRFGLTEASLSALAAEAVPESVPGKLAPLAGRVYDSPEEFAEALRPLLTSAEQRAAAAAVFRHAAIPQEPGDGPGALRPGMEGVLEFPAGRRPWLLTWLGF